MLIIFTIMFNYLIEIESIINLNFEGYILLKCYRFLFNGVDV